jgi:hypothetical protein
MYAKVQIRVIRIYLGSMCPQHREERMHGLLDVINLLC